MTDHKTLTANGVPIDRLLVGNLSQLIDQVLDHLVHQIPLYAQLPREELQGDIRQITERTLRAFAETFRTGVVPTGVTLEPLRESAARRAEEGVPLEALLAAYHLGGRVCADFVADGFRPDELPDALALNRLILDFLQQVTATVSASYFEERQIIAGEEQAGRQSLFTTLLDGGPAAEAARRAGLQLPSEYVVLGLAYGAHADEQQPGVDQEIVARRKLRRIRLELDRRAAPPADAAAPTPLAPIGPAMASLSTGDGIALLPSPGSDLEVLRVRIRQTAGVEVVMTAAVAVPEEVPAAVSLVRELLEVVRIHHRPPGVYRLDDLVLEYQLSRPSPARDRLAVLLEPLADRADLLATLRCYLTNSRDRRRTAADLHVHPNTVDYRLRQIGRRTGLDPARADHLPRLVAALAAYDAS